MDYLAILFDLDGVIIDSEPLHNYAVAATLRAYGVELPAGTIDKYIGIPDEVFLEHASQHYLAGRVPMPVLLEEKQRRFLQVEDQLQAIPGVLLFIHHARPYFRSFALATSAQRHNQQLAFDRFDLGGYFDAVVTAEDVRHTKPHPEPYLRAAELLGLPASSCLVIEDSLNGVRAGREAGCTVVALTTTYAAADLAAAGAAHVCTSFQEIAGLLGVALYERS
jgi:HAD superfamily hydrolase (TIGR01509 family)